MPLTLVSVYHKLRCLGSGKEKKNAEKLLVF